MATYASHASALAEMKPGVALRLLWRDWRGGELKLLLSALLIGVATVASVALFIDRLQQALVVESHRFLAADRVLRGSEAIPQTWARAAERRGLATARTLTFSSMVFANKTNQLVSVKAVSPGYPLRGTLLVGDEPFGGGRPARGVPPRGEVWLDSRLFPALGIDRGASIAVGRETFRVTRVVVAEPDRGGSFFDLGPRLLMNLADVPATGVIQPGSRLERSLLLRGGPSELAAFREWLRGRLQGEFDWIDIRSANASISSALERAESFLLLGGLLGVLLSGVAVALAAHRYSERQYDPVAVLKTLGMTPGQVQSTYLLNLLVLGAVATAGGLLLGWLAHLAILQVVAGLVPVALPPPGPRPFAIGAVTGFIALLAFALPPLLRLRGITPLRVIRRDLEAGVASMRLAYGFGFAGAVVLLLWYSDDLALTAWLLAGGGGTIAALLLLARGLLRGGRMVGTRAGSGWRLALAGLQRRAQAASLQIVVFGLAIMLLLILYLLRTALLEQWQTQVPEDAPNHFLINVAPHEVEPIKRLLERETGGSGPFFPMTRGRLTAISGEPVTADAPEGDGTGRLGRERNLSWAAELPAANRIAAGEWWRSDPATPGISLEAGFARENGIEVGDRLTFRVADRTLSAPVANLRAVDWDSMRPNFFILFSPGVLENFPATYLTSFYLAPENKRFLNELIRRFPTTTVIEVDAVIEQIQRIIRRVTLAVELVLGLVLAAGALVLIASIQATMDERLREHGLLRALGAPRQRIMAALAVEFATLGLFSGLLAALGAEVTVWVLQTQIFGLPAAAHPAVWLVGPGAGLLVVGAVGTLATRRLAYTPPLVVLRELG